MGKGDTGEGNMGKGDKGEGTKGSVRGWRGGGQREGNGGVGDE